MTIAPAKQPDDRPLVGIVIVGLLSAFQILSYSLSFASDGFGQPPAGPAGDVLRAVPGLMIVHTIGAVIGVHIALVLLVGSLLSLLRHPKGNATVRFGAYALIALSVAMAVASYIAFTSSADWPRLAPQLRAGMIGALIGANGAIAAMAAGILYLFRKTRWG